MHDHKLDLDQENTRNLTELWRKMGAIKSPCLDGKNWFQSVGWPYRVWCEGGVDVTSLSLGGVSEGMIFPVWEHDNTDSEALSKHFQRFGMTSLFQQTAMSLNLKNVAIRSSSSLLLKQVNSESNVKLWCEVGSNAFGYLIDPTVIQALLQYDSIQLMLAYCDDDPVATVLLHDTDDICKAVSIVGVHQLGVIPEYRNRKVAQRLMEQIMSLKAHAGADYAVLQASSDGIHLYQKLGFQSHGMITNWGLT